MSIKVEKSSLETAEEIIDKRENLYTAFEERGSNLGKVNLGVFYIYIFKTSFFRTTSSKGLS